ncbi:MAG TPA: hypothetical protein VFJ88_01225 [Chthoniobacterales bacterium]|nr:hypothetical protein [Chthoniobacterales bacterium]
MKSVCSRRVGTAASLLSKFPSFTIALALILAAPAAHANPIGDFFKNVGRTLGKWRQTPAPVPKSEKKHPVHEKEVAVQSNSAASTQPSPPAASPAPTPIFIDIRPAALAPPSKQPRDVPYGVPVPNKPGFVTSPYAPNQGYVDVHAFPRSTEVLDPFTGKIFLTP